MTRRVRRSGGMLGHPGMHLCILASTPGNRVATCRSEATTAALLQHSNPTAYTVLTAPRQTTAARTCGRAGSWPYPCS